MRLLPPQPRSIWYGRTDADLASERATQLDNDENHEDIDDLLDDLPDDEE